MAIHEFSKLELVELFDSIIGKTLGQIDINNVFKKTITNPKITGIAGDVIEQSVLNYPADNKQEADLFVDGFDVELKTTGLKRTKKENYSLEAKEPMSITAVSPDKIVEEEFSKSSLWNKLEHMLIVYYLYDSPTTVTAAEYADFTIQTYHFHTFNVEDKAIIMNDWLTVKNFIKNVKDNNLDIQTEYPKISKLRSEMLYLDTAPKYPNPPRFRLKRSFVTTIVQEHIGVDFKPLQGNKKFTNYSELDYILHDFTNKYYKKSIEYIADSLKLDLKKNKYGTVNKNITEQILTSAFGVKSGKLRDIDVFAKIGTIPKTLTLNSKGIPTEDTKFDTINFNEWTDKNISFEDSSVYDFFMNQIILCSIFEEAFKNSPLEKNIFLGFKRLSFSDEFVYNDVQSTWNEVRRLIWTNTFEVSKKFNSKNNPIINKKTGTHQEVNNLPKSKDYNIFLRGTSGDSTKKGLCLNSYYIYPQQFWIKRKTLIEMLEKIKYI